MKKSHWNVLPYYYNGIYLLIIISFYLRSVLAYSGQVCQTPNGSPGRCVSYKNCSYIEEVHAKYGANVPQDILTYLLNSRCDISKDTQQHICCKIETVNALNLSKEHKEIIFTNSEENFVATLNSSAVELLHQNRCGITNTNRISFGNVATLAEYPWMALLRYDNPFQPFQCGGSLVSNRYVVTAAHCLVGTASNINGVRLGEHDIEQEVDCTQRRKKITCYRAEDFGIEKIISHPNYNRYKFINDIGLIRLDRDVEFKEHISPICLPVTNQAAQLAEYPDKYVLAGWGRTETGEPSKILLKTNLLPKPRSYCQNQFKIVNIKNEHICAGGEDDRRDSCKGDSGGPLFASTIYVNTARYVLYGVVSFGTTKCGDEHSYPGVYTNVVQFMPWITNNIHS